MKKMILAFAVLMGSVSAQAALKVDVPRLQFGTVFVPVTATCHEGDTIRTARPQTFCQYETKNGRCAKTVDGYLRLPIQYKAEVCVEYRGRRDDDNCIKSQYVVRTRPLRYRIDYIESRHQGDYERTVKTELFTIPECAR